MDEMFNPGAWAPGKRELTPPERDTTVFDPASFKAKLVAEQQKVVDMRTAPLGPVGAWSMSRLFDFEECPHKVYLSKVEKAPTPSGEAAERGTRIHDHIEGYIRGDHETQIKEMQGFIKLIDQLRDEHAQGKAEVEGDWAFSREWVPTAWAAKDAWGRFKLDAIRFESDTSAVIIDWKGLALDTKLPTPTGWTTMGEVQEGEQIIGGDGKPCTVVGKSQVHHRPCYKLTFDDTSTVVCDDEHLWPTTVHGVISTADIAALHEAGEHIRMPVAPQTELPEAELPIDPYILGLWLGDGKHSSGEITKPDTAIWDYVSERGLTTGGDIGTGCTTKTVYGLRAALRKAGILRNKHIPADYLRASHTQRLDLLQGLMDSDGNANPHRKQAVFTTCDSGMSNSVMQLLFSLGQRPNQAVTTQRGFGKTVTAYPVHFRPVGGLNPFTLPRKRDRIDPAWGDGRSAVRRVTKVESVPTVPTQCIAVDSPDNTYLCTERWLVTHNTGRKFGNEMKHNQQGMGYSIAAFKRYPQLEYIDVKFAYLDKNDELKGSYTRQQAELLTPGLTERADRMTTCTNFEPKPSFFACRWCPHAKVQEGRDEPACKYADEQVTQ